MTPMHTAHHLRPMWPCYPQAVHFTLDPSQSPLHLPGWPEERNIPRYHTKANIHATGRARPKQTLTWVSKYVLQLND